MPVSSSSSPITRSSAAAPGLAYGFGSSLCLNSSAVRSAKGPRTPYTASELDSLLEFISFALARLAVKTSNLSALSASFGYSLPWMLTKVSKSTSGSCSSSARANLTSVMSSTGRWIGAIRAAEAWWASKAEATRARANAVLLVFIVSGRALDRNPSSGPLKMFPKALAWFSVLWETLLINISARHMTPSWSGLNLNGRIESKAVLRCLRRRRGRRGRATGHAPPPLWRGSRPAPTGGRGGPALWRRRRNGCTVGDTCPAHSGFQEAEQDCTW